MTITAMSKNLELKKQLIEDVYSKIIETNKEVTNTGLTTALFEYSNLSANEINELRSKLFEANAHLKIVKNTLIKILFSKFGINLKDKLYGQNAVLITNNNFTNALKVINEFIKKTEKGIFKLGVLNGELISANDVITLSKLPSKEVLLAQFLSSLNSPARSFVIALNEVNAKFVRVLNCIANKKI